jgi:glycosyltransferase involved in cell wall biosynthesis
VVANLARSLPGQGVETFVLCVESGGLIAERLKEDGVRVFIAEGQDVLIREILQREKPDVVNTHWASEAFLEITAQLGLPVIESIQNTYVWYTPDAWAQEGRRSRRFRHVIAVSRLVKDYYLKRNPIVRPEWISVEPNGVDSGRLAGSDRGAARQALGVAPDEFLFLVLASYDGRKNQSATLYAFEQLARRQPKARLVMAGNIADPAYYRNLQTQYAGMRARGLATLYDYQENTGSLLAAADAMILNSFFEGWSLAATEALMAGIPLVHSECGSGRDLVGEEGERGILIPNPGDDPLDLAWETVRQEMEKSRQRNTQDLIDAMDQMMATKSRWENERETIQVYARQNFGVEQLASRYSRVFQGVRSGGGVEKSP